MKSSETRPARSLKEVRFPILTLVLVLSACRGTASEQVAPHRDSATTPAVASIAPAQYAPAALAPPSALPHAPSPCAEIPSIGGAALQASWPKRLGQRVRLRARVARALDLTTALVNASGHSFVVLLAPDQLWEGERVLVFTVMGSTTAQLGGKVSLPQLLLEPDPCVTP